MTIPLAKLPILKRLFNPTKGVLPPTALRPKILSTLQGYKKKDFLDDRMAGSIVGIVALPLAIAFAIAVIIFSSQVRNIFGLDMSAVPANFFAKWAAFASHAACLNIWALAIGGGRFITVVFWSKVTTKIPGRT